MHQRIQKYNIQIVIKGKKENLARGIQEGMETVDYCQARLHPEIDFSVGRGIIHYFFIISLYAYYKQNCYA